jgi:dethiobiotin synthetase
MDGVLVIGLHHGAGEGAVAAALAAVLRRQGEEVRLVRAIVLGDREADAVHAFDEVASPLIAARHQGDGLDPEHLVRRLKDGRGVLISSVAGGVFGALTPRFTIRDLASELGLPVILAAKATPDATNLVRLSVAATRGARLTIPAVVLTGWPDPPDRLQLDERRLLVETSGIGVLELPASPGARADVVRDWPIGDWIKAAPPPPPPEPPRPAPRPAPASPGVAAPPPAAVVRGDVPLEPYAAWEPRPTGDPRSTPRPRIMEAMLEIIEAEGPMLAARAFALYNRASGGKKLTTTARAPLSSAVNWLGQERKITLTRKADAPWQDDDAVRMPDQPAVRVRELGPRTLEEVPLDEIAELMRRLRAAGYADDESGLKRAVLTTYGLVRLTQRADEYLGLAYALL